ncbi:MAG: hypothetical protein ACKOXK_06415 [Chakrabartia sp.]
MFKSSYRSNEPYIPKGFAEIWDYLAVLMLASPRFDNNLWFDANRNIDTVFFAFNEGLKTIRSDVGEEAYQKLAALSDRMRAHFEADPDETNGETAKGCMLVYEMQDILKASRKRRRR